jgi:hypothetical protein
MAQWIGSQADAFILNPRWAKNFSELDKGKIFGL